jgi:hypothetical protein
MPQQSRHEADSGEDFLSHYDSSHEFNTTEIGCAL